MPLPCPAWVLAALMQHNKPRLGCWAWQGKAAEAQITACQPSKVTIISHWVRGLADRQVRAVRRAEISSFPSAADGAEPVTGNEAMKEHRYSTKLIRAVQTTATPSKYIAHLVELKPGPVVLYVRESSHGQKHNLLGQEDLLSWEVERRGFAVVDLFREIVQGHAEHRISLERAIWKAKETGSIVVAESASRFIRSFKSPYVWPTVFEFNGLMELADGVQLATLHHPDTHWQKERGLQSKRGQVASGRRGGRPAAGGPGWKTRRRVSKLPEAMKLRQQGLGYRTISKALGVPWGTVRGWLQGT